MVDKAQSPWDISRAFVLEGGDGRADADHFSQAPAAAQLLGSFQRLQAAAAVESVLAAYTTGQADYAAVLDAERTRFQVQLGREDALGRYLGLNSFNDGYIDVNGDIGTIDQMGAFLAYRHYWSDEWRSSFTLSASQADNPSVGEFAAASSLAKAYQSVHLNLQYLPAPKLMLGGEIIYGTKELEDGRDGDMYRLQLAAKYAF